MNLIPFNNLGQHGIISSADLPSLEIPLNAWSAGQNVRFREGGVEKCFGQEQAFTTPTIAPYFVYPVSDGSVGYWIVAGLTKVHVWDGSSFTNITRQTAGNDVNYTATALKNWTGAVLGGVQILNNGLDVPQFWVPNLSNKLAALTNFPANTTCAAMRAFRRFLVALDLTESGTRYKHRVRWSHPAASGAVPSSWDAADETLDAGYVDLLDSDEPCVDLVRMRDNAVIYKGDAVHWMQYVGNIDVFKFPPMFDSFGILSRRCAVEYAKGEHAVFAVGDLIRHNGQTWESIVSRRLRRWIFNQINPSTYLSSFVAWNPAASEVLFCFPTTGATVPNMAVVWNYAENTVGVKDIDAAHIQPGNVQLASSDDIWDNDSGVWDSDSSYWGEGASAPAGKRLLLADATNTQLYRADSTNANAGVAMTAYVERQSIPVPVKPDGPPDMRSRKFIKTMYPRITGTNGGVLRVYVGLQDSVDGPITWVRLDDYTIGTSRQIEVRRNTVLLSVKFESVTSIAWKLAGYELEVTPAGRY